MPLSPPVARSPQHTRAITLNGYLRTDGLYDIEAELTDTKSFSFPSAFRGQVAAGDKIHAMALRVTVTPSLDIVACEAAMDAHPYETCHLAAPNFARLAGLRIGPGFLKSVQERVGGSAGCTHLRELLAQLATTAIQTVYASEVKRDADAKNQPLPPGDGFDAAISDRFGGANGAVNSCMAYADTGPVVRHRWPDRYRGP
jgi:hypothetical protein